MNIESKSIISVTAANQNFSELTRMVEKNGHALIFKRNKPRFMMIDINNKTVLKTAFKTINSWQNGR